VSPALAAALFHAPGMRLLTGHRLTPLALKLNVVALAATAVAMVLCGLERGPLGVALAWLAGHTLWSLTLATLVHRGVGARYNGPP
jgi:hypothetical protein